MNRMLFPLAVVLLIAACASGPKTPPAPTTNIDGAKILAEARKARNDKGCAEAAPAYRIAASMGRGFEAAQDELGECLSEMSGATPAETALLHEEGLLWLRRAAFAGNARAQRALALFYGAGDNPLGSPGEALKWALLYNKNSDSELYGYQALPPTFTPGLRKALSDKEIAAAEKFAADFSPIGLASYKPAPIKSERAARPQPQARPDGGRRRRR